ncbi:hypothetical protein AAMO2058_001735400 [Amorphochlora amoebiformis]
MIATPTHTFSQDEFNCHPNDARCVRDLDPGTGSAFVTCPTSTLTPTSSPVVFNPAPTPFSGGSVSPTGAPTFATEFVFEGCVLRRNRFRSLSGSSSSSSTSGRSGRVTETHREVLNQSTYSIQELLKYLNIEKYSIRAAMVSKVSGLSFNMWYLQLLRKSKVFGNRFAVLTV